MNQSSPKQKLALTGVKLLMHLHNLSYKYISKLAIIAENGTHPKHRLMDYHQFFIDHIKKTDHILDIGCGRGAVAYDLAQIAKQVTAIDIEKSNIAYAKKHYQEKKITFICADALSFKHKVAYDAIVLSNVLEHIEDRISFLKEIRKLAPVLLLRVPLITRSWMPLYKKELGVEYRLDKTHFTEYTLDQVINETSNAKWKMNEHSIQFGEFWGTFSQ